MVYNEISSKIKSVAEMGSGKVHDKYNLRNAFCNASVVIVRLPFFGSQQNIFILMTGSTILSVILSNLNLRRQL